MLRHYLPGTASGRICLIGSLLQVVAVGFLGLKAYWAFPHAPAEELIGLAFMHICVVGALFGCWLFYGVHLKFKNNKLQNLLLLLITCAPFFPSYATLSTI